MGYMVYDYNTPVDYNYDNTKIEITGGKAKLKLQEADLSFTENFDEDTGFIYDNTKSEFTGGLVRQKDTRPANATFYASYTSDINGNWGNGVLTGTSFGGATVSNGKLDLRNSDKYVRYDAISNANITNVGCIRLMYTPNYSGNPSIQKTIFAFISAIGSSNSLIQLAHDPSGRITMMITNSAGVTIINAATNIVSLINGTQYEIELDWDIISGVTNIFLDGSKIVTTLTSTGTRGAAAYLYIGANFAAGLKLDGYVDNVLIFSTIQHTVNYTPDWTNIYETIYKENSVILPEMEHIGDGSILAFNSFSTIEVNSPKYILQIGRSGNYLYWNGSAWTTSNGAYTQANDETTFNTNCGSLDVDGEKYGQFKIIFPDSNTLSAVATLTANMRVNNGYDITNSSVKPNTTFKADGLENWGETSTILGSDLLKRVIELNGVNYYWNGTVWAVSSGYAQSNTIAEILANKASLLVEGYGKYFKPVTYFHSEDGSTTPELDTDRIDFNFSGIEPTLQEYIIDGYLRNIQSADVGETIKVRCGWTVGNKALFTNENYEYTTLVDGYFEIRINVEVDHEPDYLEWRIMNKVYKTTFPTEEESEFSELTILSTWTERQ